MSVNLGSEGCGEMFTKIEISVCEGGGGLFSEQKLEMRKKKKKCAY